MKAFVDCLSLTAQAGHGGRGVVSFRRRRNSPRGPADGGNGGDGGGVRLLCSPHLKTLSHLQAGKVYQAEHGGSGRRDNCHGHRGRDLILEVPPGTVVSRLDNEGVVAELWRAGEGSLLLRGGRGGRGNAHFSSSRLRSPRFSQPGEDGEYGLFRFEMKLLADIALVGFPNAGKSYLQNNLTRARPKIAPYPFSTKTPNLGVLRIYDRDVVLADIPGLLAGAAEGFGLGQKFLMHIARTASLALLVDVSEDGALQRPAQLLRELERFSPDLARRCELIIATKVDLPGARTNLENLKKRWQRSDIVAVSNVSGEGLEQVRRAFAHIAEQAREGGFAQSAEPASEE